ncbi:hypothetical protein [Streptomyces venezuelae]|uniref:hypothetical protein n=1 Tax=Streptomyces venezuelae TaxID=54571 RepID=UPI0034451868
MAKPDKKPGVRIPDVKDALGDRYGPEAIDVKPRPPYVKPLFCGGCGIPVYASSGNADNPESRSSHYCKKPGTEHTQTCRFDLNWRGTELVQGSQGTVVRRSGQWRLLCPDVARSTSPGTPSSPSTARPTRQSGGGKRPTSRQAGPAIASARRIVQLLEDFRQEPDVLDAFRAVAPGGQHSIAWDEFCHDRAHAATLAQALADGTARDIPHAVWGPATTASGVKGSQLTYVVKYVAAQPVFIQGQRLRLQVALRSPNPGWIGARRRAGQFLGYGHWQLFPRDLDRAREQGHIELQLWVNEPWQVERWGIDENAPATPIPIRPAAPRPAPPALPRAAAHQAPTATDSGAAYRAVGPAAGEGQTTGDAESAVPVEGAAPSRSGTPARTSAPRLPAGPAGSDLPNREDPIRACGAVAEAWQGPPDEADEAATGPARGPAPDLDAPRTADVHQDPPTRTAERSAAPNEPERQPVPSPTVPPPPPHPPHAVAPPRRTAGLLSWLRKTRRR